MLDEQPGTPRLAPSLAHAHEDPFAFELLPVETEFELPLFERPVHVGIGGRPRSPIPDHCGRSIPEEDRFRIFEPFSRAAGEKSAGGIDLGLYIVREIVRSHGGAIEVESGGGQTRFTVQLPVRAAG